MFQSLKENLYRYIVERFSGALHLKSRGGDGLIAEIMLPISDVQQKTARRRFFVVPGKTLDQLSFSLIRAALPDRARR